MSSKHAESVPLLTPELKQYAVRLVEQVAVTFGAAFLAAYEASGASFSKAVLTGAAGAGLRAVYGLVAKKLGDGTRPSVK